MGNVGVFLDRDGTINEEVGFLTDLGRLRLIDRAGEAIRILNRYGIKTIVVSNQSGVARGYFSEEMVHQANALLREKLEREQALIDAIYYCPHHPDGTVPDYSIPCGCRKPEPGMLRRAAETFDLDLDRCFVIGDRLSDIGVARKVNATSVLVLTGYGRENFQKIMTDESLIPPDHVADHILDAVEWVVSQLNHR